MRNMTLLAPHLRYAGCAGVALAHIVTLNEMIRSVQTGRDTETQCGRTLDMMWFGTTSIYEVCAGCWLKVDGNR